MRVRDMLAQAACDPRDARWLLAHAMGVAPDRLILMAQEMVAPDVQARFNAMVQARATGQPVAQIIGQRMFWGRVFHVTPDVLDPRPETETLIAAALHHPFARVLDLGTGSGAILLTLLAERPQASGLGVDLSPQALEVAARNAKALGVAARAQLMSSDWFSDVSGPFDLIVSNPPYIAQSDYLTLARDVRAFEPRMALVPADDDDTGLNAYRIICAQATGFLTGGGWLMVEIGAGQGQAVEALFRAAQLRDIAVLPDMDGRDRVVIGQKPPTCVT